MLRLIAWGVIVAGGVWFAFEGGEFSTLDIVRQRRRLTELTARADSMQRVVDSLRTEERLVRTDPATQERIAREEFGMVRGNEILYRFAAPDSDSTTKR